jgi:putative FmdB family regulatory protein
MPIYEYRCDSCSHELEVLQKFSDPALKACPSCGTENLKKLISAAGFQLKGTGWYATDFKGGSSSKPAPAAEAKGGEASEAKSETKSESSGHACGSGACAACS